VFESTTTLNILPGRLADSVVILRRMIVPILRAQAGLLSLAVIPQPHANQVAILSIWKSRAHAQAVEYDPRYRLAVKLLDPLILEKRAENEQKPLWPQFRSAILSPN